MNKQAMIDFIKEHKGYDDKQAIKAAYQVRLFIHLMIYVVLIGAILGVMGYLKEALIVFVAMKFYRGNAGGIHLKGNISCFIWSLLIISGIIFMSLYVGGTLILEIVLLLYILVIWYLYVPQGTSQRPLRREDEKKKMKTTMLVLILLTVGVRFINETVFLLCLWSLFVTVTCTTPVLYKVAKVKYDRV